MAITDLANYARWTELNHTSAKNYRLLPRDLPKSEGTTSVQATYARDNYALYRLETKLPFDYRGRPTKRQIILDAADHIEAQQEQIAQLNHKLAAREDQLKKKVEKTVAHGKERATLAADLKRSYERLDGVKDALIKHSHDEDYATFYRRIQNKGENKEEE